MLYTVTQISEELGFSRVTIYNKIKLLKADLKGSIKDNNGVMCLDSKGLLIIKNSLGVNDSKDTLHTSFNGDTYKPEDNNDIDYLKDFTMLVNTLNNNFKEGQEDYINSLLDQIEYLKLELDNKEKQLINKDTQLNNAFKLVENSQVLLKNSKEEILKLEDIEQKEARENLSIIQRIKGIFKSDKM